MKEIKVSGKWAIGRRVVVSDEDYEAVSKRSWYMSKDGYLTTRLSRDDGGNTRLVKLHRWLMGEPKEKYVDHRDGNKDNYQRTNLRICSPSQSAKNVGKIKLKSSIYKGVHWNPERKKWVTEVSKDRKRTYIGLFINEIHAAVAYDLWTSELHGEYARLNFKKVGGSV